MCFTDRTDGDLAVDGDPGPLTRRRERVLTRPWFWLRQVHGSRVALVGGDDPASSPGIEADAAVTSDDGVALAVHTADCVPILLVDDAGAVGAVHAGWRGLVDGVVGEAVGALAAIGGGTVTAVLGPCIHPECYEFGAEELDQVARRFGPGVRGSTREGAPALDLPAAARAALEARGVDRVDDVGICTACDGSFYSHRARAEAGRQASLVWLDAP